MGNAVYDKGRQKFLEGSIAWLTDTITAVIVDINDYVVNLASHEFLSDVPVGARVATSPALTAKTTTAGVADCADITFTAVSGDVAEGMVVIKDTGNAATSPLIAYLDTATGLPVYPTGGDVVVVVDAGPNKLFKL